MFPIRTIVLPTDFSDESNHALHVASALARDHGATLVVVHVAEPYLSLAGDGGFPPPIDLQALREKLRRIHPDDPTVEVKHRLAEGDPAREILRIATEVRCDLIVMGTHGRRGLGRLLIGSVAEQVLRKACCPVLTVKTPPVAAKQAEPARPGETVLAPI